MTQAARDQLYHIERALAVMYAEQLGDEEKITPRTEQDAGWMIGILRAWDQVHTLLETGQVKQFPYQKLAEAVR